MAANIKGIKSMKAIKVRENKENNRNKTKLQCSRQNSCRKTVKFVYFSKPSLT